MAPSSNGNSINRWIIGTLVTIICGGGLLWVQQTNGYNERIGRAEGQLAVLAARVESVVSAMDRQTVRTEKFDEISGRITTLEVTSRIRDEQLARLIGAIEQLKTLGSAKH